MIRESKIINSFGNRSLKLIKNAEFSLSQPHGYFSAGANQQTEVAIEAKKLLKEREDLEKALAEETGRDIAEITLRCLQKIV